MGRRSHRWVLLLAVVGAVIASGVVASAAPPADFVDEVVFSGLNQPTNVEFAPDGRVFVAEKGGVVKVFDSLTDPTPDTFADLSSNVHDFWDRGLLGLAIHPSFPSVPFVYVLYTYGVPLDPGTPTWGDGCPDPPGATDDGCVVSGRLSRLEANGNQMTGPEVVLIEDWCQQYPSHSIGDLEFGPDGALYATGGDGASFTFADWGQGGGDAGSPTPENPCGDPPVPIGGNQQGNGAEGGALRSQDLETSGDPVSLDGTIIRIDPITGEALSDNPLFGAGDENAERVISYGLRNPFRMAIDQSSGEVYVGDVGWNTWEEVNRHPSPTGPVSNFGWPCYEGGNGVSISHGSYDHLDICSGLYASGTADSSLFAYRHTEDISGDDPCPPANPPQGTSSSVSGLDFYPGGQYPGFYNDALFGSDYSRDCIWVMYRDGAGQLDPTSVEVFQDSGQNPVDIEAGPNGDIFYANLNGGQIRRLRFVGDNTPPVAVISADPTSGAAPLSVDFDGSGSSDPDSDEIVLYEWDLDDDGFYDDAVGVLANWVYAQPGSFTAGLRITDSRGESDTDSVSIQASNSAPTAVIDSPLATFDWHVGESVNFIGHGTDPEEGALPSSAMTWTLILHHCEYDGSCHEHTIQTFPGVGSGSFTAPDHEYPSWLELQLTVSDQFGVQDTATVQLQPETVELTFATDPNGLDVSFFGDLEASPFTRTVIVAGNVDLSTPANQAEWVFQSWSNGGARSQSFAAPSVDTTYTAVFDAPPTITSQSAHALDENLAFVADLDSTDNADSEGSGLAYSITGGADAGRFNLSVSTGVLTFITPPNFESPGDVGGDNVYDVVIAVTDTSGLSDSQALTVSVDDVNEVPVASDDSYATNEDVVLVVSASGVLSDDIDPDSDPLSAFLLSGPVVGVLDLETNGSFTYTPAPDWSGQITFEYEACDAGLLCGQATVTVSVGAVNDAPVAEDDAGNTDEDQLLVLDVSSNDHDPEGPLNLASISIATAPSNGSASANPDGTVTYTPASNWNGVDVFEYTILDGDGAQSNAATVTVTVEPVNDLPIADAGPDQEITLGETANLDGTGSEDPIEGDPLTYSWTIESAPGGSTASLVGGNTATPTFAPDEAGSYVLRLTVDDGEGSAFDTMTIDVSEVQSLNLPPVITSNGGLSMASLMVNEGDIFVTDVETSDPNGDTEGAGLTYSLIGGGDTVRFSVTQAGIIQFTEEPDFENPVDANSDNVYILAVQVKDSGGLTDTQQVSVTVIDVFGDYNGTFRDDDNSIFESSIEWLASEKITFGCNPPMNDLFCPKDFVTRGQMAAFFARAFGWMDVGPGDLFIDDDGHLFEHAIDMMGTAGVTKGCNPPANNRFCPNDVVTRGQMAAFFARAFGWMDVGPGDLFIDDDGHVFENAIDLMGTAGVTKGCNPPTNSRFCPSDFVTREQMAAFFERAFTG